MKTIFFLMTKNLLTIYIVNTYIKAQKSLIVWLIKVTGEEEEGDEVEENRHA